MYGSIVLTVHTIVKQISSRTFSSCKTETEPIKQFPILPSPQPLLSFSMNLTKLDISCKWNLTVFVFLWLDFLSSRFIPVVACDRTSFLRLSNIMYILHFIYPFICWRTFRLLPPLSYCALLVFLYIAGVLWEGTLYFL